MLRKVSQRNTRYPFKESMIMRISRIASVSVLALAIAGGAVACGSAGSPSATAKPVAAVSNGSNIFSTPDTGTVEQKIVAWVSGPGFTSFEAVGNDADQLSTDAGNEDTGAMTTDGAQMVQDANAALQSPPPFDTSDYNSALNQLVTAGQDLQTGNYNGATTALQSALVPLGSFTTAAEAYTG
jgi:hypothetical protein